MGLFSYFRRRRERESAISPAELAALTNPQEGASGRAPQSAGPRDADAPVELRVNLGGNVDLGSLLGMAFKAMQTGTAQVTHHETQTVDLTGSGLRDEILETLRANGIDPQAGPAEVDASAVPGLQEHILKALAEHGVDPPGPGGVPVEAGDPPADGAADGESSPQR